MLAAKTTVPVLGVPVAQPLPAGRRFAPFDRADAQGRPGGHVRHRDGGAANAALFAVAMLANEDPSLRARLDAWRARQTDAARAMTADLESHE
jgi:5-(carboxyamino)imidazole ribonucleotide mutase